MSRPFSTRQESQRAWYKANKAKVLARNKTYHENNKDRIRSWHREYHYGISLETFSNLLHSQWNMCGNRGCKELLTGGKDTHVDHDHVTGKVRGLLCRACNLALGLLKDDTKRIQGLRSYLEDPPCSDS